MKKFWKIAGACVCTVALAGFLAGCSSSASSASTSASASASSAEPPVELKVFAANSLEKVLPEIQALYTASHPNVSFADNQTAASGTLVTQLADGASADVLITASKSSMDTAEKNGSVDAATRITMFNNDLIICVKEGSDLQINSLEDLATNDAITSIAIGDPNVVPAGKYALQSLESAGLVTYTTAEDGTIENIVWADSIAGRINAGADKVGTVAKYVSGGEVTVGFIYTSDLYRYTGIASAYVTPSDSHKVIVYPGAVVANSANAAAAADFINFCINDPEAQKLFSQYGFELAA